jgi:protein O-mannosyl-transferase
LKFKISFFQLTVVLLAITIMIFSSITYSQTMDLSEINSVRAVVIGISDYQNNKLDLQYARSDAEAFCDYLRSSLMLHPDSIQIKLLTDNQVTRDNIWEALRWLSKESKKGSLAIFYYSGHGDVEGETGKQHGYLITYDSPENYYESRAFRMSDLQDKIDEIVKKEAKALLIVDACRSGKLAGGIEGAKYFTVELKQEWENTAKILSTKPGLLSFEYNKEKNGYFTYYLLKGLKGLADFNRDKKVDLGEIEDYLEDSVKVAVGKIGPDYKQIPIVSGDKETVLAKVDTLFLVSITNKETNPENEKRTATRGQQSPLASLDSLTKELIYDFKFSLNNGFLISSPDSIHSAWSIYNKLKSRGDMIETIDELKVSLISSLQNNSQIIINAFVNGKTEEANDVDLSIAYQEILHADSLIDKNSMFYEDIRVKCLFMESLFYNESDYEQRIKLLKECVAIQPDAPFSYCELGRAYYDSKNYNEAITNYEKAIAKSPRWKYPYYNLGIVYTDLKQYEKAVEYYTKAIEIDPYYTDAYNNLGIIYYYKADDLKAIEYYNKAIETDLNNKLPYYNLGLVYSDMGDSEKALFNFSKALELDSNYVNAYDKAGIIFYQLKDYKSGISTYNKYIEFYPDDAYGYQMRGLNYFYNGEFDRALQDLEMVVELNPNVPDGFYNLACYYSVTNNTAKSLANLEKAFQLGYNNYDHIEKDYDLDGIRSNPDFKKLIEKYKK